VFFKLLLRQDAPLFPRSLYSATIYYKRFPKNIGDDNCRKKLTTGLKLNVD